MGRAASLTFVDDFDGYHDGDDDAILRLSRDPGSINAEWLAC